MHPTYVEVTRKNMENAGTYVRNLTIDDLTEDKVCDTAYISRFSST